MQISHSLEFNKEFNSRRSAVHSTKGVVSSSQPLATAAGLKILEQGGNAAMAAVATAAAIAVTEPMMNGLGGDAFALFYDAKEKTVKGFNGSGKAPRAASIDMIKNNGHNKGPRLAGTSPHAVTVPGAVATWEDVVNKWGNGKLTLAQVLAPAIELAENGFPVSEVCARMWNGSVKKLKDASPNFEEIIPNGEAPKMGDLFINKNQAEVLKRIAKHGKAGYYTGPTADAIVETLKLQGGAMSHEDLESHETLFVDPVSIEFEGVRLHEIPPNGQGIVALQALGTISALAKKGKIDLKSLRHNSPEYLHLLAETLKFGFKDAEEFVTDYEKLDYDPNELIDEDYLVKRAELFDSERANPDFDHGVLDPKKRTDTVYFTTADSEGNACSFITSLYTSFGSGIVPKGCGFALHNRGCNFNLTPGTRNAYEGGKRPYHTIIPGMITHAKTNDLYAAFGVMGGFMQPQGHVQVLLNMLLFGMNPQEAIDSPRLCLTDDPEYEDTGLGPDSPVSTSNHVIVALEDGIDDQVAASLQHKGHKVKIVRGWNARGLFGRGQVIKLRQYDNGRIVWTAGSDPRCDGHAAPQL